MKLVGLTKTKGRRLSAYSVQGAYLQEGKTWGISSVLNCLAADQAEEGSLRKKIGDASEKPCRRSPRDPLRRSSVPSKIT